MAVKEKKTVPTWLGLSIIVVAVWLVFRIGGGDGSPSSPSRAYSSSASSTAADERTKEAVWTERGKDAVRAKLKDPDSAQFRSVFFRRGPDGVPVACGEVNSKNSFGGYGGFQKFISAGKAELTFLEEEMADGEFAPAWNRFCAG